MQLSVSYDAIPCDDYGFLQRGLFYILRIADVSFFLFGILAFPEYLRDAFPTLADVFSSAGLAEYVGA